MRCWCFNKAGQRCDLETSQHDTDEDGHTIHTFTIYWTDDEAYTPGGVPNAPVYVQPLSNSPLSSAPMGYTIDGDGMAVPAGAPPVLTVEKCAGCGCFPEAHDATLDENGSKIGCGPHQCKTYVPGG